MAYFHISQGLRGCYMADSIYTIRATTRRELKEALEDEARHIRDAGFVGLSKVAIASLAAGAWRRRNDPRWCLDLVAPYRAANQPGNWAFGLFVSRSDRASYLAEREEGEY